MRVATKLFLILGAAFGPVALGQSALAGAAAPANAASAATESDVVILSIASADKVPPPVCAKALIEASKLATENNLQPLLNFLSFNTDQLCAAYLMLSSKQFIAANTYSRGGLLPFVKSAVENEAIKELKAYAQQSGSSSGTGGSTSATSKGLSSKLLSIASEYGALSQSINSQTTTVQGSLAGVPLALGNKGVLVDCSTKILAITPCVHHEMVDSLSRFSYSVSFNGPTSSTSVTGTATGSATGTSQPVKVSGSDRSVTAFSAKAILIPGKPDQTALSKATSSVEGARITSDISATKGDITNYTDPSPTGAYRIWLSASAGTILNAFKQDSSGKTAIAKWKEMGTGMVVAMGVPEDTSGEAAANSSLIKDASKFAFEYGEYVGAEESATDSMVVTPVLSVEYDDNRPVSQPSNSVVRGIYQKTWKTLSLTVNGAVSFYNTAQTGVPGAGRLRDSQFVSELAHNFSINTPATGNLNLTLSGAFYDQYQSSPAILNVTPGSPVDGVTFSGLPSTATQIYAQKGNIALGQIKLSVGGGSAVTVPLSMTYSNRTELITTPTWKAQIGISYDFDTLFSGSSGR
jgi:hypothetical protein